MQSYFFDCFSGLEAGAKTGAVDLLGWEVGTGAVTGGVFWLVLPGEVGDVDFWKGLKPIPAPDAVKERARPKREINNLIYIQLGLSHKLALYGLGRPPTPIQDS